MRNLKNNNMKRYILVLLLISPLFLVNCEDDFLDKNKLGEQTIDSFYSNESEAFLALTGVYSSLRHLRYISAEFIMGDVITDDAAKGSTESDGGYMAELKEFRATADNTALLWKWVPLFRGIYNANLFIQNAANAEMDDDVKKRFTAEARFLRAFYYFDAVRTWGDLPLMKVPYEGVGTYPTKLSKAEIYSFIVAELEEIAPMLPKKASLTADEIGRTTYGAAYGLLAKVSLYTENWANVRIFAQKVFDETYSLEADYAHMFSLDGENGAESVFEIQFEGNSISGYENTGNFSTVFFMPRLWGWGFRQPTAELYNLYEAEDSRRSATIMTYEEAMDEERKNPNLGDGVITDDNTGYYSRKNYLTVEERPSSWRDSPVNKRVIRLADLYLMYSEASYHLDNEADARVYVNLVRERARNGNSAVVLDINSSGEQLLSDIYKERRLELAMEAHRYWDIIRTKRYSLLHSNFKEGKNELMPIPQAEIDNSDGILKQNPGY